LAESREQYLRASLAEAIGLGCLLHCRNAVGSCFETALCGCPAVVSIRLLPSRICSDFVGAPVRVFPAAHHSVYAWRVLREASGAISVARGWQALYASRARGRARKRAGPCVV